MALLASYVRSAAATLPQDEEEEEKDGAGVEENSGVCVGEMAETWARQQLDRGTRRFGRFV